MERILGVYNQIRLGDLAETLGENPRLVSDNPENPGKLGKNKALGGGIDANGVVSDVPGVGAFRGVGKVVGFP